MPNPSFREEGSSTTRHNPTRKQRVGKAGGSFNLGTPLRRLASIHRGYLGTCLVLIHPGIGEEHDTEKNPQVPRHRNFTHGSTSNARPSPGESTRVITLGT